MSDDWKPRGVDLPRIWALKDPPKGTDGERWSARWVGLRGIRLWALEDPTVAERVDQLYRESEYFCVEPEIHSRPPPTGSFPLILACTPAGPSVEAYTKRQVSVMVEGVTAARLRFFHYLLLTRVYPRDPYGDRYLRLTDDSGALREVIDLASASMGARRARRLPAGDQRVESIRRARAAGLGVKTLRSAGAPLTDLRTRDVFRVVEEAERVAEAFWTQYQDDDMGWPWPLFPDEVDRLRRPEPSHRPQSAGYDFTNPYDKSPKEVRPAETLKYDLTLERLGLPYRDPSLRNALRQQCHAGRIGAGGAQPQPRQRFPRSSREVLD